MNCINCKYYLPIDAFKGVCKLNKKNILADEASCEDFDKAAKCEYCAEYQKVDEVKGLCKGKYDAFAAMNAKTCSDFKWN